MKKQILTTVLLLMLATWLHAQENKHAQAMRTAFVETIYGKFPKGIEAKLKSYNEDSVTVAWGEWGCLDGGGLVPKEKIHVVMLSKTKSNGARRPHAAVAPHPRRLRQAVTLCQQLLQKYGRRRASRLPWGKDSMGRGRKDVPPTTPPVDEHPHHQFQG